MSKESVAGGFIDEEELLVFQGEADETDDLAQLSVAHVDCFMQFLWIILNVNLYCLSIFKFIFSV